MEEIKQIIPNIAAELRNEETVSHIARDFRMACMQVMGKNIEKMRTLDEILSLPPSRAQEMITKGMCKDDLSSMVNSLATNAANNDYVSWMNCLDASEAGMWLCNATTRGALKMTNDEFQTMLCYRLFLDQPNLIPGLRCHCIPKYPKTVDSKGHHLFTACKNENPSTITHDNVNREVAAFLRAFGYRTKIEETHVFTAAHPNSRKRPDISIQAGQVHVQKTIVDVTITGVIQKATQGKIVEKGKRVEKVYNDKVDKYQQVADNNNLNLVPLVFASTGSMHKKSLEFMKMVAGVKVNGGGDDDGYTAAEGLYKYMMTKVGMVLQKSLANA